MFFYHEKRNRERKDKKKWIKIKKSNLIIEALEFYYENETFMEFDRNKGGIEYSFEMLKKSIQVQEIIIKMKKEIGMNATENEEEYEKIKKYWNEDLENPNEIIEKLKEELEYDLEWIPREIENSKERGWGEEYEAELLNRYKDSKEKLKKVKTYTERDVKKITGMGKI